MPNPDKVAADILRRTRKGQIFSVLFVKRSDGSLRKMVARRGVKAEGSSEPRPWSPRDHDLLQVWDMEKRAFRFVPMERVIWLKAGGDFILYDRDSNHSKELPL